MNGERLKQKEKFVVLGGGIAGLLAGATLRLKHPNAQVSIIERAPEPGGLLAGYKSECGRYYFDCGTHVFRETGIDEIDGFMLNAIPSSEMLMFQSGCGDFSGSVYNGYLQENSHFIDIRNREDFLDIQSNLLARARLGRASEIEKMAPAAEQAECRFGDLFSTRVLVPVLEALYQRPVAQLAAFAFVLPGLTRVVALDEQDWFVAAQDEGVRDIIAVPEQRNLPAEMRPSLRSFYVRNGGSSAVIKGIRDRLIEDGVVFSFGTSVDRIDLQKSSILLRNALGRTFKLKFDGLFMGIGAVPAAGVLGVELSQFKLERPIAHRLIHLVVEDVKQSHLFYFYGLDPNFDFYRVTNYRAITGDSNDCRLTIEILGDRADNDDALLFKIVKQLRFLNWIDGKVIFAKVTRLQNGFPTPSLQGLNALSELSDRLAEILPENVALGGAGARRELFFQNEVVKDAVHTVRETF